ncbi:hypothetical protein G6F16_013116 [Rhizopus arrhizus]|nr:hypothetical protein G6F23_012441 [Rhizopus arrhizus]KAG0774567.1 hypothetical protein G6F22_013961 [Rhizopus arrhizus]KAG0778343.1 hypothetical protein G6F21_013024 [Rhizopus arrhizus]KAG0803985.1 hypothetical protein G6F20_013056 [Rhizopus arrhizus]KAG0814462.1 hypothetical protein G6F19_013114 [Rhizopus arrhizus]
MEKLKNYYITPELIQSYELEFNEMYQGEQEHPQIFLARLREASDLANINNEALIQSRFRAGLLREIKQFCIQSSARSFQEWTNHAEGWWNANRPRKIAMVDNPFIPRNINSALIYQDDNTYNSRQILQNHNIELIDTDERPNHFVPINNVRTNGNLDTLQAYPQVVVGPHQLTTMEVTNRSNNQSYLHHMSGNKGSQSMYPNQQEDFLSLIQKTIRMELNNQQYQTQQPTRNYYRRNRFDNYQVPNYNGNDGYHKNDYNDYNNFNGPRASNNYNRNNNRYNNRNNYNNDFNRNYNNNDIRANSDRNDTTNRSRFQPQNDNNQRQPAKN